MSLSGPVCGYCSDSARGPQTSGLPFSAAEAASSVPGILTRARKKPGLSKRRPGLLPKPAMMSDYCRAVPWNLDSRRALCAGIRWLCVAGAASGLLFEPGVTTGAAGLAESLVQLATVQYG